MSSVQAEAGLAVRQVTTATGQRKTQAAVLQCLVVSTDRSRREMLMRAANESGWDAVVCADAQNAMAETRRTAFQLALIDLEGHHVDVPVGFRRLCEHVSAESGSMLLAVCGHEGNAREEIWARQLGAWLYLPGLDTDGDISPLCDQAREIVEKRIKAATPA